MAAKRETLRRRSIGRSACFPLVSVDSVVDLFRTQLTDGAVPDLALLSIILGAVENQLTAGGGGEAPSETPAAAVDPSPSPPDLSPFRRPITFGEIEALYGQFAGLVRASVDAGPSRSASAKKLRSSTELIKTVSNTIWAGLSTSYYKDRAHMQSIYSFLTGERQCIKPRHLNNYYPYFCSQLNLSALNFILPSANQRLRFKSDYCW